MALAVVPGARAMENAEELVTEVKQRLGDEPPRLITSDELPAYATAIENVFGTPVEPGPTPRPGPRPILPERRAPEELVYATVHKERERNRVVAVRQVLVLGDRERLDSALEGSTASCTIILLAAES